MMSFNLEEVLQDPEKINRAIEFYIFRDDLKAGTRLSAAIMNWLGPFTRGQRRWPWRSVGGSIYGVWNRRFGQPWQDELETHVRNYISQPRDFLHSPDLCVDILNHFAMRSCRISVYPCSYVSDSDMVWTCSINDHSATRSGFCYPIVEAALKVVYARPMHLRRLRRLSRGE